MFILVLIGTALAVAAGFTAKCVTERTSVRGDGTITGVEFALGSALIAALLMPLTVGIGFVAARADAVTFNETWGGLEESYKMQTINCTKDGSCTHTYDCDDYQVEEVYYVTESDGTETYRKSDGTTGTRTKYKQVRKTRWVTKWHSCPYVTSEYTFTITDTLGATYTKGSHWFPESPSTHRWHGDGWNDTRFGNSLPNNVKSGIPTSWTQAKARIDAGTPGGTKQVHTYKNYILASQKDIYAKSSDAITTYKKAGLLPKPSSGTYDDYLTDQVYPVGSLPGADAEWQEAMLRFNGHFGGERQGDMHLVVVTDPKVTNPDEYAGAIQAYWQSPELGKNAVSKNAYVVIVGSTDGTTIDWARGFSGMPHGNENLSVVIREDLPGTALTASALIGTPQGKSIDGTLGTLTFAKDGGFTRVEMAGFSYLYDQITPTTGQKVLIVFVGLLLAIGLWTLFVVADVRLPQAWSDAIDEARRNVARKRAVEAELANMQTPS